MGVEFTAAAGTRDFSRALSAVRIVGVRERMREDPIFQSLLPGDG